MHKAGFEPAKLLHKILSLTPLTARELMLILVFLLTQDYKIALAKFIRILSTLIYLIKINFLK